MAKQLVNPVERHFEKGVLGVAGLVLIWTIATYLIASPNHVEIGGETVRPSTIDQKVAQKAALVRDRTLKARANVEIPDPLAPTFETSLNPLAAAKISTLLPIAAAIGPAIPIIDPPEVVEGESALVKIIPTSPPVLTHGRSTFLIMERDIPMNWVTVSVVMDIQEQMAEQGREYGAARKEVLFGPTEMQRRTRRPDGSWSDEDWQAIKPSPTKPPPPARQILLETEGDQVRATSQTRNFLETFLRNLRAPTLQLDLIRPLMHDKVNGDPWEMPIITTKRDVLIQDDYYLNRKKPPAASPVDRYATDDEDTEVIAVKLTPDQILQNSETLRLSAWTNKSEDLAIQAYNTARDVADEIGISPSLLKRAETQVRKCEQTQGDVKRWENANRGGPAVQLAAQDFEREPNATQQIWAHDAAPGSIESGQTYQYRIRPTLYNRLVGQPEKFRNPADATIIYFAGDWSKPVEVEVEPDMVFFVNSKDDRKNLVGVVFYRWFEGVWVQSDRFKVGVGDAVEGSSRCIVPSVTGADFDQTAVDFTAHATVVDIDFKRPFRERKKGKGRDGVRFAAPKPACSVVFADSSGRLHERYLPAEKSHPDSRMYRSRKYVAPKGQ